MQTAEEAGRVTSYERHDRAAGVIHGFRFVNDVPLNASRADVRVHFIEYWEIGPDQVQHFSWVTDLRVSTRNVYTLMRGAAGSPWTALRKSLAVSLLATSRRSRGSFP